MALPTLSYRGDMIVMVDWTATSGSPGVTWVNFCGANGIDLTIDNAVQETVTADCTDWTLPPVTVAAYGAQTVTMSVNANVATANRDKLLRWAKDQLIRPVRVHIVQAAATEVEYIDGLAMLPSLSLGGLANTDGSPLTITLNLRFRDGVTFTNKA